MKISDPLGHWDPILKWLFIGLFVSTGIGAVLMSLIFLKGQDKWVWEEEENQYWNQIVVDVVPNELEMFPFIDKYNPT